VIARQKACITDQHAPGVALRPSSSPSSSQPESDNAAGGNALEKPDDPGGEDMVRIVEQSRIADAARDERCIYSGIRWVRQKYRLHQSQAASAISEARRIAGHERTQELLRLNRRADLSALLQKAESKWPGILDALRVDPYRRVAERYGSAITPIWRVRSRLQELCLISGQSEEDVVRAILSDL
jgi:hypothetical protein